MNNNAKNKEGLFGTFAIPAAVILSYVSALCALPSSGIFTSLPVSALLAIAISFLCKNRKLIYGAFAIMHLLTPPLFGYSMKTGVISAVIAVASAYLALLAKRAVVTLKKSDDSAVKNKSKTVLVISALLCIVTWLVCMGNPVSFIMAEGANKKCAEERYPDKLESGGTFFDVTRFEYVTEIKFNGADGGRHYYISSGKTDDYLGFHIEETLLDAADYFSARTALPADALKCYIAKEAFIFGETRENNANYKNTEYLMERSETVTGMDGFEDLYKSLTVYAEQSEDLVYKSFTMTAKDMNGKTYYAYKEFGKDAVFTSDDELHQKELKEKFN